MTTELLPRDIEWQLGSFTRAPWASSMPAPELVPSAFAPITKRALDIALSVVAILALSPLWLAVALLVKTTSRGPVLYRQERIGKGGTPFRIFKFRSMTKGAESQCATLMAAHGGYAPYYKLQDDPRVTRLGKWLRRASIDELPQLVNVVLGHMSLVGPRPQVQAEVDQYEPEHHKRLLVKPGMTGLWQVSGRSDLKWRDAARLDVQYVETWSLAADFRIMLKTPKAVTRSRGAY